MKRKIVQISAVPAVLSCHDGGIYALCDDGSLWSCSSPEWQRLPDIPQEPDVPEPSPVPVKEPSKKSISAKRRWANASPEERRKNMEKAFTIRWAGKSN